MARISSDAHGVYAKVNGTIKRPADGLASVLSAHDLNLNHYSTWLTHGSRVTRTSAHLAGATGVKASHIRQTPLARVGDEVWIADYLTPYSQTPWLVESARKALVHARVMKRIRLGERISNGEPFRRAFDEELAKITEEA